ncbi:MAG: glycosyltransferase family 2 protein [Smithella sp.]|jgi:hypothetical protein
MTEALSRPKISIVTPSLNQGHFIEDVIRSVLFQKYPNLEYVIIDGNSKDGSADIIRKYEQQLTYWVSEPDTGQYDAVNKGFRKTTGEIMGWINSDDKYLPWTFSIVAEIFAAFPHVEWLTTSHALQWDREGRAVWCGGLGGYNKQAFFKGANLPGRYWYATGWIQQESTFWRRSLWERVNGQIDSSLKMAGDFDLWARFFHHAELYAVSTPLGGFRLHGDQKTGHNMRGYIEEAEFSLLRNGGKPYGAVESAFRRFLHASTVRHEAILKSHLPSQASVIIKHLPLFYSVKLLVWWKEGWKLEEGYIV